MRPEPPSATRALVAFLALSLPALGGGVGPALGGSVFAGPGGDVVTDPGGGVGPARGRPAPSSEPPLFLSHEPLNLILETDLEALDGDRGQDSPGRAAVLRWTDASGAEHVQELLVSTRGNFRLKRSTCSFPPLRLNLKKGAVEGTVFEGQDKLKVVTHCRGGEAYEQNVLEEYLAYRIYNLLTDVSFRVRLVRVTWVDGGGKDEPLTRFAFLIEDDDALAARVGGMVVETSQAPPEALDGPSSVRTALFQYLIGNTDWSAVFLHNVEILRLEDGRHVAVPYDFDFSGLVDAAYARPAPEIGTDDVRTRVYRGFCRDGVDWLSTYSEFGLLEEPIRELVRTLEGLSDDSRERALAYLGKFYEIIGSGIRRRLNVEDACRRM